MIGDRDTNWSVALLTAISFLGLLVSVIVGTIGTLSGASVGYECFALGAVCGASFLAHLRSA